MREIYKGVILIKYMGSKSRIAKDIVPIIQKYIDDNDIKYYYEPFVGGANVIDKIKCENRIGNDLNKYLIALLKHVSEGGELLPSVDKELYNEVRTNYQDNIYESWYVGNIGFLASYNGRWFDGGYAQSGYEKTKKGLRLRDYYQESKRNIEKQNLNGIEFLNLDYRDLQFKNKSVIYCDPPYNNTRKYANAIEFNYDEFWNVIREWSKNHIVIVSELSAPSDFQCIWEKEVLRSLAPTNKSKATEKLFIYRG